MNVVLVTGGFDPLRSGHISYFKAAKALGKKLVVGLNSDEWLARKKGKAFMTWNERATIIEALECVDRVINFNDDDGSATGAIVKTREIYPDNEIIFANGGDRQADNIPELFDDNTGELTFVYGVGGDDKKNSSSWILEEFKNPKTMRDWGYWRVLDHKPEKGYKVKELVIYPGKSLSDQKHFKRSEQWIVLEGEVQMDTEYNNNKDSLLLKPHTNPYEIGVEVWHKASNPGTENAHILELQWGSECIEEDIERRD